MVYGIELLLFIQSMFSVLGFMLQFNQRELFLRYKAPKQGLPTKKKKSNKTENKIIKCGYI